MFLETKMWQGEKCCIVCISTEEGNSYQIQKGEEGQILNTFDTYSKAKREARKIENDKNTILG